MAQDGQQDTPPSTNKDEVKVTTTGNNTDVSVAVADQTPAKDIRASSFVGSQMLIDFDAGKVDPQMTFDFENEGVGITPVSVSTDLTSDKKGPDITDTSTGPIAAAVDTAAATAETSAEGTKIKNAADIAPVGEETDQPAAETTKETPDIAPIGDTNKATTPKTDAKPAETGNTTVQPDATNDDDEGPKDTRYRSHFAKNSMGDINAVWGAGDVDDELKETLGLTGKVRKNDKYGLDFHLPNGHTIEWHANLGGAEFIGMRKRASKFDEEDAHAVAVTALARGWKAINVHGTVKQKEMMWLQAKLSGLEVANFEPVYSDDPNNVRNRLAKLQAESADKAVIGASAAEQGMINVNPRTLTTAEQTSRDSDPIPMPEADAKAKDKDAVVETPRTETPKAAVVETAAIETDKSKPVTETPVAPETAAAETGDSKSKFVGPKTNETAPESKPVTLQDVLAQERESALAAGDKEKLAKLDTMETALAGNKLTKDAIVPAVQEAATKAGVTIPVVEAATSTPAATDKPAPKTKKGGGPGL